VRDGENGVLVADMSALGAALRRAVAWWEQGQWAPAAEANARLIAERATLRANVQQFLAVHRQVRLTR
jgi:hypothetical protein